MNKNYRLYVNAQKYYFESFDDAKFAAQKYMKNKPELRIEILMETTGADFWAYEYEPKSWVPS